MSSRKYIPPHLRRSSVNKPPPASTNDTYQSERQQSNNNVNRYRQSANPYGSNRRMNQNNNYQNNNYQCNSYRENRQRFNMNDRFNMNNANERTLEQTKMSQNKIETINLDQYIVEKQKYKEITIGIITQFTNNINIATLIYDICNDDKILIPNTFQRDEFLKYWFIINKGESVNKFRYCHRVDLYPNHIEFIQRGGIASIKGYKPSLTAKLKLQCKFIYHDVTDYMRFSFRSNGVRERDMKYSSRGRVYCEDNHLSIYNKFHHGRSNAIALMAKDKKDKNGITTERLQHIPSIPLNTELSVVMIDDGNKINATYCSSDGIIYSLASDSNEISKFHRVIAFNRELEGNIADIIYLQLSVITK